MASSHHLSCATHSTFSSFANRPVLSHRHSHGLCFNRDLVIITPMASSNGNNNNNSNNTDKGETMSFGDRLLDYIEGGPKLRKWYGAPEQLPRDAKADDVGREPDNEGELEDDEVRDGILITDGDNMTGQLVLLSLIVKRARVRALVKDAKEFTAAFGSYIEPVVGDVEDKKALKKALRGVRAVVCPSKVGALSNKELVKGVEHIVLLSQFSASRVSGGLASLFNANARRQAEQDEASVQNHGIPCTIIRCAPLRDEPGGQKGLLFEEGSATEGTLSREDAAMVCIKALDFPPQQSLILEVANGGVPVNDWNTVFNTQ